MNKTRTLFGLFISMLKIGLFTFGGGYAMIHLLDDEFVGRRAWLSAEEFTDLVVISESTPGPIAINCATYIGYKKAKILGSSVATLGICIPSFTIIYLISLFFDAFLSVRWVQSAFRGIQLCVVFLILSAGLKMFRRVKKTPFSVTVMTLTLVSTLTLSLLSVSFSSIFYILIFGTLGLLVYAIKCFKAKREGRE